MIKDVLIHLQGTKTDLAVLTTGLEVARLFNGHMECVHIMPDAASLLAPQVVGPAGTPLFDMGALKLLEEDAKKRAAGARESFFQFCSANSIVQADTPPGPASVSAMWRETNGDPEARLIALTRLHDLVVVAPNAEDASQIGYIDVGQLILGAGRPVLLAPRSLHTKGINIVAIAWKNTPEAARAITAAMPILSKAHKIIVFGASEREGSDKETHASCERLANSLRWHGMTAESRCVAPARRTVPDAVLQASGEAGADLLVMGGYGHSRLRELIFGGFTRRILQGTELPVFIFH